ncbi:hypothetical protein BJ742DRAFT_682527 [Cladochytrium replicatum]|nr:hypothetical protein BJ742DRAFT_682527 [Cladochytrium replicatum]
MVRVFVSCVDSAIGHNLSLALSRTAIGSRREEEPAEDAGGDEEEDGKRDEKVKETYTVIGTLVPQPKLIEDGRVVERPYLPPTLPGPIVETGNRKKDLARREAVEKFSVMGQVPKWVSEVISSDNREALRQALFSADVIIYDLVQSLDEATWAIETLAENSESFLDRPKAFIALSTIMTWAKTKVDQDDPDGYLTEEDYRRRKPHPNFKQHLATEKTVIKCGKKSALKTYVVASGLVYHPGDSIIHYLFKAAWHNEDELICYGEGGNVVPTIQIDDLCNILVEIVETTPETRYLLAIDESKNSLMEITKAISEGLGTGKVRKVAKESAFLNKNIQQTDYDMLQVNLRLEPGHVKEMSFEWKCEGGLIENLPTLIQTYKDARGLTPLKVIVHGPPASGKTFFARKIAEHYEIHFIDVDKVVHDALTRLERRVAGRLNPDEVDDDIDVDRELLEEIKEAASKKGGRYADEHVIGFVRDKLRSMPCKNQGYVLDGFPTTVDEAKELFRSSNEDDSKDEKAAPSCDEVIGPEYIISLDASDEYVKERVMSMPEAVTAGTKYSEEAFTRRLEEYRQQNTDENTVLNYFDELEIHPFIIAIDSNAGSNLAADAATARIIQHIGKPHNYGPTPEQLAEKRRMAEEAKAREAKLAEEERLKREKEEAEKHTKAVAEWNARLEEVRKQEQEVLEAQSIPLRHYLMKYVMPTLTSGLIEVSKVRPEDPIDYLAEYLFKVWGSHNVSFEPI